MSFCCLTSTEARRPIRTGTSEKRGQKSKTSKQAPTRKTKTAVDRRQNNRMLRQCPSGIVQRPPHHAIAVPTARQNSHKDNARSSTAGKQLKQKKSNSQAQLHLPALDLFSANFFVRVQLTSLLSISPGLWGEGVGWMKCCLVSSDVSWHIRDKLWPMPKHGSINLYVLGNQKAR